MISLHDLVSYHIQQHFIKSTNCIFLPPMLTRLYSQYTKSYSPITGN